MKAVCMVDDKAQPVPGFGALLGIDYGTRRIGVAISNEEQSMAMPLENYTRVSPEADAIWMRKLARGYGCRGVVVGLPVHMSGDESGKSVEARQFGQWVAEVTGLPVVWWDERFSSAAADHVLEQIGLNEKQRRGKRDRLAAHAILQSFLDSTDRTAAPLSFHD